MARGRSTRADMRGEPLDEKCYKARTTTREFGNDDDRTFCYGLVRPDCECEAYLPDCVGCGALVWNAEPIEEVSDADSRRTP